MFAKLVWLQSVAKSILTEIRDGPKVELAGAALDNLALINMKQQESKKNNFLIGLVGLFLSINLIAAYASEDDPVEVSEDIIDTQNNVKGELLLESVDEAMSSSDPDPQPEVTAPRVSESQTNDAGDSEQAPIIEGPQLPIGLDLLGSTVLPGEAALLKWVFEATFVDTSAPVPVLVVNGLNPGPTLCVTAAVHGDELNGIEVVRRIVHEIDPQKLSGAVIGVPIVNLQGFRRASRYLPDRRDLNRYFPGRESGSYASRVAHSFFSQIITKCDYLVDVHTGSLSRTNLPQIRADLKDSEVAALAEKMGNIVVLQSVGALGTLRRSAVEAGIPAVTLEAGAPNNLQKEAVEQGVKSILSALSSLELTKPKSRWQRSQEPVYYQSTWIRARQGGILFSKVELGDSVDKGSVLGLLSDPITNVSTEIVAPFEGRVIGMALNQVMYPGFAAYHIGLKSSAVEAAQPTPLPTEEEGADLAKEGEAVLGSEVDSSAKDTDVSGEPSAPEVEKETISEMSLPTIDADKKKK